MKEVTWKMSIVSTEGFSLENYLNRLNFQPGKFFVVPNNDRTVTVYYVESEVDMGNEEDVVYVET